MRRRVARSHWRCRRGHSGGGGGRLLVRRAAVGLALLVLLVVLAGFVVVCARIARIVLAGSAIADRVVVSLRHRAGRRRGRGGDLCGGCASGTSGRFKGCGPEECEHECHASSLLATTGQCAASKNLTLSQNLPLILIYIYIIICIIISPINTLHSRNESKSSSAPPNYPPARPQSSSHNAPDVVDEHRPRRLAGPAPVAACRHHKPRPRVDHCPDSQKIPMAAHDAQMCPRQSKVPVRG